VHNSSTALTLSLGLLLAVPGLAQTPTPFTQPQQQVDIGGRKINLYCSGAGATTVIFDSPSGEGGWSWFKVQPEVAKHTRACTWDRAGLGFSDPAARPNTSENAADDLHRALQAAGVKPPYLLVGNSLGGSNVQVYAYRHPEQVKGLVLVEPQSENLTARLNQASGGMIGQFYGMLKEQDQYCLQQAAQGFKAGSEEMANCVGDPAPLYGPELGATVQRQMLQKSYWQARADEFAALDTSDQQLHALRKPLGDLPLLVLTRSVSPYADPGKPQSAASKATEEENAKVHHELAALSSKGAERVVPQAGHVIQEEQPAAVTAAVLEVLGQIQ